MNDGDNKRDRDETRADDPIPAAVMATHSFQELKEPPPKRQSIPMKQFQHAPLVDHADEEPKTPHSFHKLEEPPSKQSTFVPTKRAKQDQQSAENYYQPIELRDTDVLSGRGGASNIHRGNRKYWRILLQYRTEYQSVSSRDFDNKHQIANKVYNLVRQGGTRFIRRSKKEGLLEELSKNEALEKIKQCLRSRYTPLSQKEAKSDPDEPCILHKGVRSDTGAGLVSMRTATQMEVRNVDKRPSADSMEIAPARKKATGHSASFYPLSAGSEHSTMSQLPGSECEESGWDRHGEIHEGYKDSSGMKKCLEPPASGRRIGEMATCNTPTCPIDFESFDSSNELLTHRNHVYHYHNLHHEEPVAERHLLPASQKNHLDFSQQPDESLHDDGEVLDRLGDIPEDIPGQPGMEWLPAPAVAKARASDQESPKHSRYNGLTEDSLISWSLPRNRQSSHTSQQPHAPVGNVPQELELKEADVLSGQGSGSANRPGNQRYLQKVRELQHAYWSLEKRDLRGKTALAKEVYNFVKDSGGRFVHKRSPLDLYVEEISEDNALKKIRRALRDGKSRGKMRMEFV